MVSSTIAASIGGLITFFEIIISAVVGIFILQNFKYSLQDSINKARSGEITQEEFIKTNAAKAIGAILLIIPGFFTDFIGIALQFGLFTMVLTKIFKFKPPSECSFKQNTYQSNFEFHQNQTNQNNTTYKKRSDDEIIDVEIIDDSKSIKH
jgi:2-isopropylmalate synthase/UPF0716 protein FxsA